MLAQIELRTYNEGMNKYNAVVIGSVNAGEADRLYYFFTEESGLVAAFAKGIRKPSSKLAGHLDTGNICEIYIARSKGKGQITQATEIKNYSRLKKNWRKLFLLNQIFSFIRKKFSEGEKDLTLFNLIVELLDVVEEIDKINKLRIAVLSFWWKLMAQMGHRPLISPCEHSKGRFDKKKQYFFDIANGKIVCERCAKSNNCLLLEINQVKFMRIFFTSSISVAAKIKSSEKDVTALEVIKENFLKYNF